MPETVPRFVRLHAGDNVLTVAAPIEAGKAYSVGESSVVAGKLIPVGFKIATCPIPKGSKVIKYGVIIGSATCDIAAGEVVHMHNLKSDYLPTYLRGEVETR